MGAPGATLIPMRSRALALMWLAAAAGSALIGCRARLDAPKVTEALAGSPSRPGEPSDSDPRPGERKKPNDESPPPSAPPRERPLKDDRASRKGAPPRAEDDAPPARDEDDSWRVKPSTQAAAAAAPGAKPDPGEPEGHPVARRPDGDQVISPGPPVKYLSPAPLKALATGRKTPGAEDAGPQPGEDLAEAGEGARRPAGAPPVAAMMDDSLPETGIGDPDAIGSYHVQIASSADFGRVLFDKTYPFMGEIDLAKDLEGAPEHLRTLWLRYALVDLLDFEHPFTRPRRIVRRPVESREP